MAARARSEPQWRSKWPLEPALELLGALGIAARARLGAAGALEIIVRAPSASLGRSKWPLELPRPRWGARNRNGRTSPIGVAGAVEIAAQARSASLERSH